ncbi:MAG: hypothetical protein ACI86H_000340 [bacterium]|jgi:hypothetical protein
MNKKNNSYLKHLGTLYQRQKNIRTEHKGMRMDRGISNETKAGKLIVTTNEIASKN